MEIVAFTIFVIKLATVGRMIARLRKELHGLVVVICVVHANMNLKNQDNVRKIANYTFKNYIEKFRPSLIWKDIEESNKRNGLNKTFKDEFEKMFSRIDESEELLNLKVKNGDPKIVMRRDGRRWRPPGNIVKGHVDPFQLRPRFFELIKQAIYQARTKMIIMQDMREKYKKISVYKMGFLVSKADTACKTFAKFAYKAFRACTFSRQSKYTHYYLIDILEANERLLDLWFDVDLLVDLVNVNHQNCLRMLNQVIRNRKYAWKFVD